MDKNPNQKAPLQLDGTQDIKSEAKKVLTNKSLFIRLLQMRNQQMVITLYRDLVKDAQELENYERSTYLDDPDAIQTLVEEAGGYIHTPEDRIEQEEITDQFFTETVLDEESRAYRKFIRMNIRNDFKRLYQVYLDSNTNFQLSMPSQNIPIRLFQVEKIEVDMGSLISSSMVSSTLSDPDPAISCESRNLMTDSLVDSRIEAFQAFQDAVAPFIPVQIQTEQQQPQLYDLTMSEQRQKNTEITSLFEFLSILRENASVSAEILRLVVENGTEKVDGKVVLDLAHRSFLVNWSQLFFDNLYQEDKQAFSEKDNFLRVFNKFADTELLPDRFNKDQLDQVCISNEVLKQAILCLMEGLTRKIPAINFLTHIYTEDFSQLCFHYIVGSAFSRPRETIQPTVQPVEPQKMPQSVVAQEVKPPKEEKKGFWARLFSSDKNKDKEKNKDKDKVKVPEKLKDGEMEFDFGNDEEEKKAPIKIVIDSQPMSKRVDPKKGHTNLCQVYHDESWEQHQEDESELKRQETVEQKICEERINKFTFLYQEHGYTPSPKDRIRKKGDEMLKEINNLQATLNRPRDFTNHVLNLVQKIFDKIGNYHYKIPYAIRAMLRVLVEKSRMMAGRKLEPNKQNRIKLEDDEIHMLAEILIGGWLNTGFRNPKCFGIHSSVENELEFEFVFFQAARLIFEHTFMLQRVSDRFPVGCFDIPQINRFIEEQSTKVFGFFHHLLNIDISEISNEQCSYQIFETQLVRFDDLDLLLHYSQMIYENKTSEDTFGFRRSFGQLLRNLKWAPEKCDTNGGELIISTPYRHKLGKTLRGYFEDILEVYTDWKKEERYMMLYRKCTQEIHAQMEVWDKQTDDVILQLTKCFVKDQLMRFLKTGEADSVIDQDEQNSDYEMEEDGYLLLHDPRAKSVQYSKGDLDHSISNSMKSSHQLGELGLNYTQSIRSSQQHSVSNSMKSFHQLGEVGLNYTESIRSSQQIHINSKNSSMMSNTFDSQKKLITKKGTQLKETLIDHTVINIFNCLTFLLQHVSFILETLNNSNTNKTDLIYMMNSAIAANETLPKQDIKLSLACKQVIRQLHLLEIQDDTKIQIQLLRQYQKFLGAKTNRFRKRLDAYQAPLEMLRIDVERFEGNINQFRRLYKRLDNQLKFNRFISRADPQVCIQDNKNLLNKLPAEYAWARGINLFFSCHEHQVKSVADNLIIGDKKQFSPEEDQRNKMRTYRIQVFRQAYKKYIDATKWFQNCNQELPIKVQDLKIQLVEAFLLHLKRDYFREFIILLHAAPEKYAEQEKFMTKEQQRELQQHGTFEPCDYFNLARTYQMFLEHISVISSEQQMASMNEDEPKQKTEQQYLQLHLDFLKNDIKTKALRYNVHDYLIRRIYRSIVFKMDPTWKDLELQRLLIELREEEKYRLYYQTKEEMLQQKKEIEDIPKIFTLRLGYSLCKHREWTNPQIFSNSIRLYMKIAEKETPHEKAALLEEAITSAIEQLFIIKPQEDRSADPEWFEFMYGYLSVKVAEYYADSGQNPRLYTQLLFTMMYDLPAREQAEMSAMNQVSNYTQLTRWEKDSQIFRSMSSVKGKQAAVAIFNFYNKLMWDEKTKQRQNELMMHTATTDNVPKKAPRPKGVE